MMKWVRQNRWWIWVLTFITWAITLFIVFIGYVPIMQWNLPIISKFDMSLRIAVFSTLAAAGIPGLYNLYTTWVSQPEIETELEYTKTFLRNQIVRCDECNWSDLLPRYREFLDSEDLVAGQCPNCYEQGLDQIRQVIPVLFSKLTVTNIGESTARDAFVTFNLSPENSWYGRWNTPDNPTRFDLHPKDERGVHIFRTYIDLERGFEERQDDHSVVTPHDGFVILENQDPDFQNQGVEIRTQNPMPERPEVQGESSFAGWHGDRVSLPPNEEHEIEFTFSAEDWYRENQSIRVRLDEQLKEDSLWKENWKEDLPKTVAHVEERLNEVL